MQWTIVADSGCDMLPAQLAPNVTYRRVPLSIRLGGEEWVDNPDLDTAQMVAAMESYKGKSSSACPSPDVWKEAFSAEGNVIAMTITGGLSGSFNAAICARDMLWETQPDKHIFVLDTRSAGAEMALLVQKTCELIQQGLDFDAVVAGLRAYHQHTHLLFVLEHVDNFVKNGRLSKLAGATIGMLGIRVVGCASEEGTLQPLAKPRGTAKGYELLVRELSQRGYQGGRLAITHVANEAGATRLVEMIHEKWPDAPCTLYPASGLCSYYGESQGLLVGYEDGLTD